MHSTAESALHCLCAYRHGCHWPWFFSCCWWKLCGSIGCICCFVVVASHSCGWVRGLWLWSQSGCVRVQKGTVLTHLHALALVSSESLASAILVIGVNVNVDGACWHGGWPMVQRLLAWSDSHQCRWLTMFVLYPPHPLLWLCHL